jgi:hypothetical protein
VPAETRLDTYKNIIFAYKSRRLLGRFMHTLPAETLSCLCLHNHDKVLYYFQMRLELKFSSARASIIIIFI